MKTITNILTVIFLLSIILMTLEKFVDITFKEGMKKNNQIKNDTYGNEYVVNNANVFCYKSI